MNEERRSNGVDFHCHLDLYPDFEAAVQRAEDARIYTLAVTTTPMAWPRNRDLTRETRYVRAALGIHPQLVAERPGELALWESYLPEARFIGEVGLDAGPRFYKSLNLQKIVFRRVLECCSSAGGKILTVHSVRSVSVVLDLIEECLPADRGKVVLHWFTGTRSEAKRAAKLGCYFSINAQMTKSESASMIIPELPVDRLLTETDGPFTSRRGKPAEPADVGDAVNALAQLRGTPIQTVGANVRKNLRALLAD